MPALREAAEPLLDWPQDRLRFQGLFGISNRLVGWPRRPNSDRATLPSRAAPGLLQGGRHRAVLLRDPIGEEL